MSNTVTDARLAAELAERSGELLLEIRSRAGAFDDAKQLGRDGDLKSNELLLAELAQRRPGDAVLSEESADSAARLSADRVWIIDPLDGTREYSMAGRDDWAVHVALWERGELTAGAVSQPARGVVYATDTVAQAPANTTAAGPRIVVSASRAPELAVAVAKELGGELVPMGSAGAKTMAVVRGDAEMYVHAGGQWEWDSAAPVAVALAAGLHCSRIDGSPLVYNEAHPYLPDLLICRPELAARALGVIERFTSASS